MNTFVSRLDHYLPFDKTERTIIGIVLLMHAIFFIGFHKSMQPNTPDNLDDSRVMANLVSPEAAKPAQPPAPPPPKPKQEEKKKTVNEKSTQVPIPPQSQQQAATPPSQQQSKSNAQAQNTPVAPATNSGGSGTPIFTEIGKLEVLFTPDADPFYPSASKRACEKGVVEVQIIINTSGEVEDVLLITSSSFPKLDRAAKQIAQGYRFKPFSPNGVPVRTSTLLKLIFNVQGCR